MAHEAGEREISDERALKKPAVIICLICLDTWGLPVFTMA